MKGKGRKAGCLMPEWVMLVERVGYPIAVSFILFWSIRSGIRWYGVNVLKPKAEADVALLSSVRDTNDKHATNQAKLVEAQLLLSTVLDQLAKGQEQLAKGQETQTALLRELSDERKMVAAAAITAIEKVPVGEDVLSKVEARDKEFRHRLNDLENQVKLKQMEDKVRAEERMKAVKLAADEGVKK